MPAKTPKPCNRPGCRRLTRGRYCEEHLKQARQVSDQARRGQRHLHGGGNTKAWRELRAQCLARDPICKMCDSAPSTVADHIVPKRLGGLDELRNLRGLCKTCHDRHTGRTAARARKGVGQ